jgi:hypothetical protein
MAMTIISIQDCDVYLIDQSVWGTAELDSVAGLKLDVEPFDIEFDDKMEEGSEAHKDTRAKDVRDIHTHQNLALPTFTLTGAVHVNLLGRLLYGLFQNVVEGGTTPFEKTFTWPTAQPDFTANAGMFFTLIAYNGAASVSYKLKDIILKSLTINGVSGQRVMFEAECIGRGTPAVDSNPSGTYSYTDRDFIYLDNADRYTLNFGGGDLSPIVTGDWSIKFEQDVLPVGQSAGDCESFGLVNRRGTFTSKALWDSTTRTLVTNIRSDTEIDGRLGWGHATAGTDENDVDFVFKGKVRPETKRTTDEILSADMSLELCADKENSEEMTTIIVADAIDETW